MHHYLLLVFRCIENRFCVCSTDKMLPHNSRTCLLIALFPFSKIHLWNVANSFSETNTINAQQLLEIRWEKLHFITQLIDLPNQTEQNNTKKKFHRKSNPNISIPSICWKWKSNWFVREEKNEENDPHTFFIQIS